MPTITQYELNEIKPLRSDTAEQWEEKERLKARLMIDLAGIYGGVAEDYQEVLSYLLTNSDFAPNGVHTIQFDPAAMSDGDALVYDSATQSFLPSQTLPALVAALDAKIATPAQYSRVESIKTDGSVGTIYDWESASVLSTNVRARGVADFNEIRIIESIDETVTLPTPAPSNYAFIHIYAFYDDSDGSTVLSQSTTDPSFVDFVNSSAPANVTHIAYLGAFYVGGNGGGSIMVNREMYLSTPFRASSSSITLTGVDIPVSETLSFSFLSATMPAIYEGGVEVYKLSGDNVSSISMNLEMNGSEIFSSGSTDRYSFDLRVRERSSIATTDSSPTVAGTFPAEMGTGTARIGYYIEKIKFDPVGYLA